MAVLINVKTDQLILLSIIYKKYLYPGIVTLIYNSTFVE